MLFLLVLGGVAGFLLLLEFAQALEIDFMQFQKHSSPRSTFQYFFLLLQGVEIGGMPTPSAVTKSARTLFRCPLGATY